MAITEKSHQDMLMQCVFEKDEKERFRQSKDAKEPKVKGYGCWSAKSRRIWLLVGWPGQDLGHRESPQRHPSGLPSASTAPRHRPAAAHPYRRADRSIRFRTECSVEQKSKGFGFWSAGPAKYSVTEMPSGGLGHHHVGRKIAKYEVTRNIQGQN